MDKKGFMEYFRKSAMVCGMALPFVLIIYFTHTIKWLFFTLMIVYGIILWAMIEGDISELLPPKHLVLEGASDDDGKATVH